MKLLSLEKVYCYRINWKNLTKKYVFAPTMLSFKRNKYEAHKRKYLKDILDIKYN